MKIDKIILAAFLSAALNFAPPSPSALAIQGGNAQGAQGVNAQAVPQNEKNDLAAPANIPVAQANIPAAQANAPVIIANQHDMFVIQNEQHPLTINALLEYFHDNINNFENKQEVLNAIDNAINNIINNAHNDNQTHAARYFRLKYHICRALCGDLNNANNNHIVLAILNDEPLNNFLNDILIPIIHPQVNHQNRNFLNLLANNAHGILLNTILPVANAALNNGNIDDFINRCSLLYYFGNVANPAANIILTNIFNDKSNMISITHVNPHRMPNSVRNALDNFANSFLEHIAKHFTRRKMFLAQPHRMDQILNNNNPHTFVEYNLPAETEPKEIAKHMLLKYAAMHTRGYTVRAILENNNSIRSIEITGGDGFVHHNSIGNVLKYDTGNYPTIFYCTLNQNESKYLAVTRAVKRTTGKKIGSHLVEADVFLKTLIQLPPFNNFQNEVGSFFPQMP